MSPSLPKVVGDRGDPILDGLDGTTAGISVWSSTRILIYANRAFINTFDIRSAKIGVLHHDDFIRHLIVSNELSLLSAEEWSAAQIQEFGTEQHDIQSTSDGRTLDILRMPSGNGGMTVTVHDISALKSTELALRSAKEAAEESGDSKSRFLRAANHDLRQPLATLRILIFSCLSETDEAHRKDLFHAMDVSVSIMEDLLSALLQIGQLDAGIIVPRVTTFQLTSIFERLNLQYAHQAAEKGLKLRFAPTRAAVMTDKSLLERILSNLLANALRYTDVGGVVIGCRKDGATLRIEIWDSGRGIPAGQMERIFEEFYQIPDGRWAKRPGLGLGLNIVHRLAKLIGHPITVRSQPGKGSVFSIAVPLGDIWHSEAAEPEINEAMAGEFVGKTVLLIEDDAELRGAMQGLLERWGMRVSAIGSEAEIRRHLTETPATPDLIIADFRLRNEVGTDLVERMRIMFAKQIPAVIVTADATPEVVAQIKAAALPILIKPVSPPRLRVMMHNLLFEPAELMMPPRKADA